MLDRFFGGSDGNMSFRPGAVISLFFDLISTCTSSSQTRVDGRHLSRHLRELRAHAAMRFRHPGGAFIYEGLGRVKRRKVCLAAGYARSDRLKADCVRKAFFGFVEELSCFGLHRS